MLVANYYPRCPNPDVALGLEPHSDQGLLTLLLHNEVSGLQIQHERKWVNVNAFPNSVLVNIGDLLEVYSNGKYKSVLHRAVVNNQKTRISIAMFNGPSLETIVCPAPQLLQTQGCETAYVPMKYKDFLFSQQNDHRTGKAMLKHIQKSEEKFTL
ncbi:Leucocyanidin oxygenase [Handroanthus impetiginosus]|uniref:Leucocyanidin oxygenase n=1 Tax=Handroanthus impetiginosus TaxID=429701 RepID=A0A2G9G3V5_9LAMI|nr:Leucocyanidin oxygenase [Handroanthus impetiginosus]